MSAAVAWVDYGGARAAAAEDLRRPAPGPFEQRRRLLPALPTLEQMVWDDPELATLVLGWDVAACSAPTCSCAEPAPKKRRRVAALPSVAPTVAAAALLPPSLPPPAEPMGWTTSSAQRAACSESAYLLPARTCASDTSNALLLATPRRHEHGASGAAAAAWLARGVPCVLPPIPGVTITTGHERTWPKRPIGCF